VRESRTTNGWPASTTRDAAGGIPTIHARSTGCFDEVARTERAARGRRTRVSLATATLSLALQFQAGHRGRSRLSRQLHHSRGAGGGRRRGAAHSSYSARLFRPAAGGAGLSLRTSFRAAGRVRSPDHSRGRVPRSPARGAASGPALETSHRHFRRVHRFGVEIRAAL